MISVAMLCLYKLVYCIIWITMGNVLKHQVPALPCPALPCSALPCPALPIAPDSR